MLNFGIEKEKSIICAILGASLVTVVEARKQQCRAECQTVQSLQALVEKLKMQLSQEQALVSCLQCTLKEQLLVDENQGQDSYCRALASAGNKE